MPVRLRISAIALHALCIFASIALVSSLAVTNAGMPANAAPAKAAAAKAVPAKAAPAPSARKPVNVDNSAALSGYWNRLRVRLQNNWQVPDGKNNVVLTANISSDGSSSDVVATGHPKDAQAEVSATEAFNKSLPLEALPSGVSAAAISVDFEYEYDPHGDGHHKVSGSIRQTGGPAPAQKSEGATTGEGASKF